MSLLKRCEDSLKKLHGLAPYNVPTNISYGDPYFAASIRDTFPDDIIERASQNVGVPYANPKKAETKQEAPRVAQQPEAEPCVVPSEKRAKIAEWEEAKNKLDYWKLKERQLRDEVSAAHFKNPTKGVNKNINSVEGYELVADYPMTNSISKKALPAMQEELASYCAMNELEVPEVIRVDSYGLALREYNKLTPELKSIVDTVITSKLGAPKLTLKKITEQE